MHVAVMLSACQWGWITGSMDAVSLAFQYHKTATYQFARRQLEAGERQTSMLTIAGLALAEVGHIGSDDLLARS